LLEKGADSEDMFDKRNLKNIPSSPSCPPDIGDYFFIKINLFNEKEE
jgi:hypothetical protein